MNYHNATYEIGEDGKLKWTPVPRKKSKWYKRPTYGDISDIRRAIFDRDHHECFYCGSKEHLCLDHIIPKPLYEIHTVTNLITSCIKCNFKKNLRILPPSILSEIYYYIIQANASFFTEGQMVEYNNRLAEYWAIK